jgi:hypothetical protein
MIALSESEVRSPPPGLYFARPTLVVEISKQDPIIDLATTTSQAVQAKRLLGNEALFDYSSSTIAVPSQARYDHGSYIT